MFPYLQALKIAAVVGVLALAGFAGWTANGWRLNERAESLAREQAEKLASAEAAYAAKLQEQQKKNDELVKHEDQVVYELNSKIDAIRKENHGPLTVAQCDHPFTTALPVELNRLSDAANGTDVPASSTAAPNSTGTPAGDSATASLTGQQLVDWYAEVANAYGKCKAQLDAVRVWDSQ